MAPDPIPGPVGHISGDSVAPGGFAVTAERSDGEVVVAITGEVDIATAPRLWERLEAEILTGPSRVVLDLSGLGFIDSTGLTVIIRAHKRLGCAGATLVLRSPTPPVARVLTVSGLDQVLDVEIDPGRGGRET